jgi:hypothetical protein
VNVLSVKSKFKWHRKELSGKKFAENGRQPESVVIRYAERSGAIQTSTRRHTEVRLITHHGHYKPMEG